MFEPEVIDQFTLSGDDRRAAQGSRGSPGKAGGWRWV